MTPAVGGCVQGTTHIEPLPSEKVHVTTKQELIELLQELNKHPEIKKQLLDQLNENDHLSHTAKELLNEDLTASTLIIEDDEKGEEWLAKKKEEFDQQNAWYPTKKPEPTWRYVDIVAKPARAIWWTGKTAYKVYKIASAIIVPLSVIASVVQSPWTNILLYLAKKIVNK
jgi:hypothetical protein